VIVLTVYLNRLHFCLLASEWTVRDPSLTNFTTALRLFIRFRLSLKSVYRECSVFRSSPAGRYKCRCCSVRVNWRYNVGRNLVGYTWCRTNPRHRHIADWNTGRERRTPPYTALTTAATCSKIIKLLSHRWGSLF